MIALRSALAAAVVLAAVTAAGAGEARVALVIGNNAYEDAPLRNARNDAEDLAKTLTDLGFDVQKVLDADLKTTERAVNEFIRRLPRDGTALFYYSGHGIEIDGENFLVPVGFKAEDAVDAKYAAYSAERLLARMEAAPTTLNVIVLDACRNNPFRSVRSSTRGLAIMNAGDGSFIAYATAPHATASDNPGKRNGLFTEHLLKALAEPGLELEQVFKEARKGVYEASGQKQVPWTASSVIGEFVFREERRFPYQEEDLELLDQAIAGGGWTGKRRDEQGMIQVTHERTGLGFVLIPTGEGVMGTEDGDEDERPARTVKIPAFLLCRTECTQAAWDAIGGDDERPWRGPLLPINAVKWSASRVWCAKAGLRLPSEAEWEYACRAGSRQSYSFGASAEDLAKYAWFHGNTEKGTYPAGQKLPNNWGLLDMHGNVWEWCEDDYLPGYQGAPSGPEPRKDPRATHKVIRGGSWENDAALCRSAVRGRGSADGVGRSLGFRPAFSITRESGDRPATVLHVKVATALNVYDGAAHSVDVYLFSLSDSAAFEKAAVGELLKPRDSVPGGFCLGRWTVAPGATAEIEAGTKSAAAVTRLGVHVAFRFPGGRTRAHLVVPPSGEFDLEILSNSIGELAPRKGE